MNTLKPLTLDYIREVARTHSWPTEDNFDDLEAIKFLLRELDARASLAPKGWPSREEFYALVEKEFEPVYRGAAAWAYDYLSRHAAPQAEPDSDLAQGLKNIRLGDSAEPKRAEYWSGRAYGKNTEVIERFKAAGITAVEIIPAQAEPDRSDEQDRLDEKLSTYLRCSCSICQDSVRRIVGIDAGREAQAPLEKLLSLYRAEAEAAARYIHWDGTAVTPSQIAEMASAEKAYDAARAARIAAEKGE